MSSLAFTALVNQLQEIESFLSFSSKSKALRPRLSQLVAWNDIASRDKSAVQAYLSARPTSMQPLLNGLYLVAVASFEEYLRATLVNAIRAKVAISPKFEQQPSALIRRNMKDTARFLTEPEGRRPQSEVFDACRRIATCVPGSMEVQFNDSAIAGVGDILRLDSYFRCLDDIGYVIGWDDLGREGDLQALLSTRGVRETTKEIKDNVAIMYTTRNSIAHKGLNNSQVTEELLLQQLKILKSIASVLDEKLTV